VEAGHFCGKKLSSPVETSVDTRALGIGSSNMLRLISLQLTKLPYAQSQLSYACTQRRRETSGETAQRRGVAYNFVKRVKAARLSGSVPFRRLSLKALWQRPNAE
jgi:hypothetical protein